MSGHISSGAFAGQSFHGEFSTDLVSGAAKCTGGAIFGGLKDAPFEGTFGVD